MANIRKAPERNWSQILAISVASLVGFTRGILFTWPSPSIPKLIYEDYPGRITLAEASYLTSLSAFLIIFAAPFTGILMDKFGRKRTLLLTVLPHLLTWTLTAIGGNIYVFYAARLINGIGDAMTFSVVPPYITEVSTPKVRCTWGNTLTFAMYFGNFVMNVVGAYFSIRTSAVILMSVPLTFLVACLFMPESPYYLLMEGRVSEARKSLQWLRRRKDVEDELTQLTSDVERQLSESGTYKDIFVNFTNRRAIFTGAMLRAMQQFAGISVFSMYTQIIFIEAGGNVSASTSAIIYTFALVICNVFSSCILNKIGRRAAMVSSNLGCGLVLVVMATYFYLKDEANVSVEGFKILPLIGLLVYVVFYSCGLGLVPTLMLGELFSSSIKGKALCLMNICFGVYVVICTKLFSFLLINVGLYAPFYFYAVCCFLGTIAAFYFVPETRGKTLEQIQQDFKSNTTNKR